MMLPVNREKDAQYRHEYKYFITEQQIEMLKPRLKNLISLDPHVTETGIYNIRSLYFDDIYNTCFYENENGTDPREKFRIRIYNHSSERISLELKQKVNGKCRKLSCRLTKQQCIELMNGRMLPIDKNNDPVLNKLLLQMNTRLLRPSVIVEYDRIPYVSRLGNVRITFDMNIESSYEVTKFLDEDIKKIPVNPNGVHILEVKWDDFIPDYYKNQLNLNILQWTAFSKYYMCRCHSLGRPSPSIKR